MRERQIHPAIFVEVKRHDPHRGRQLFLVEIDGPKWSEFSFARIEIDGSSCLPARNDEVHGAIIIEVRSNNPRAGGAKSSAVPADTSVNVLFPLLRQRTL